MNAETLRQFASSDRPTLAKAFHGMLVDFGYADLPIESVTAKITSFMDGDPEPEDIIAKFVYGWLNNGINE